ncbi:hypothetical protein [Kitasatospora purpeofusca]|uniref:hypothetical protein n=1 Tax=Kitasatospora purpeofusca TaxID=67352 RepID=UPI0038097B12
MRARVSTLRALRLRRTGRPSYDFDFDFDSAWRQARMRHAPDEIEYLLRYCARTEDRRPTP